MNIPRELSRVLVAVAAICWAGSIAAADAPLPAATNLLQRAVARAEEVAKSDKGKGYTYQKRSVTAELDEKDRVVKSQEKIYKVVLIGGMPYTRLVKIQGRALSGAELEKENEREQSFRKRLTGVDANAKASRKESFASKELMDRFTYKVLKREMVEGRSVVLVSFEPKVPAPEEKTIPDRVLNRLSGTIWLDEEEAELVRLKASVRGPIQLGWFGMIGALNRCLINVDRQRLPDGVWVNTKSTFELAGRKLLTPMRYRTVEESSGFAKE